MTQCKFEHVGARKQRISQVCVLLFSGIHQQPLVAGIVTSTVCAVQSDSPSTYQIKLHFQSSHKCH